MNMNAVNTQFTNDQALAPFISNTRRGFDSKTGVSFFSCDFNIKNYKHSLFQELSIICPPPIHASVIKRQAEFLAGRYAARSSILQISPHITQPIKIEIGVNRAPIWPPCFTGSITHSRSRAISVSKQIGDESDPKDYIGVDVEDIIDVDLISEFESSIYTHQDRNIALVSGLSPNIAMTLIFSAKESLFEAIYPFVGEYFGFDKARVGKLDIANSLVELRLDSEFASKYSLRVDYLCRFEIDKDRVFTIIFKNVESFRMPS
ncbi:MAG: 4'-phosphopantetheinyl transferase superfamily protein [Arenicella sp.]|nr:4'-phosphopantetheinyl transferase superfamily protein [Arenicella sp.]